MKKLISILMFALVATFAQADFRVDWDDNSSAETGFVIQRSIGTGAFGEVGRVASNVTTYRDTTANAELTTYNYRVAAFKTNAAGTPETLSAWSNVASATTPLNGPTNARTGQIVTVTLSRGARAEIIASK